MNQENKKKGKSNLRLFRKASSIALKEAAVALEHLKGKGGKSMLIPIRSSFIRSMDSEAPSRLAEVIGAGKRRNAAGQGGRNAAGKGGGEVRLKLLLTLIMQNPRGWTKETKKKKNPSIPDPEPKPVRGLDYANLLGLYRSSASRLRVKMEGDEANATKKKATKKRTTAELLADGIDYQGAKRVYVALDWLEKNKFVVVERSDDIKKRTDAYGEAKADYDKAKVDYKGKKRDERDLTKPKKPRDSVRVKKVYVLREGADSFSSDRFYIRPQKKAEVDGKEAEQEPYTSLPMGFWLKGWIGVLPASALAVLLCLLDFSTKVNRTDRLRIRIEAEESYSLSRATWYKGSAYLWAYGLIEIDDDAKTVFTEFKAPIVYTIYPERLDEDVGLCTEAESYFSGSESDSLDPRVMIKRGFHFELAPDELAPDEPDTDEPDTDEPDTDEPDTDEPDTEHDEMSLF